jgi:hypothetical protein
MNEGHCQQEIFAFLADATTHGGGAVQRIDTHAASVFLAGERAFKVKRAVRFPFLDYSTLAKRKPACEAELAINRSFAPDIYRRVVAIARENDAGSSSMARARRSNGHSKCAVSTRMRRSTGWRRRAKSMRCSRMRSAARWRRFTPAPARSKLSRGSPP